MSYETGYASMGRIFAGSFAASILYQGLFALAYGWLIAQVIFRLPWTFGIVVGILMGLPLYLANAALFRWNTMASEVHAVISHMVFALIFTGIYRAMAIPKVAHDDARPAGTNDSSSKGIHAERNG